MQRSPKAIMEKLVLVVEDNLVIQKLVSEVLKSRGYRVLVAADGL